MLIGLCGAICAGKRSVADYLVAYEGFSVLYLEPAPQPLKETGWEAHGGQTDRIQRDAEPNSERRSFATGEALLEFVTKRWQSRWVTIDIHDNEVLEKFSQRPWFLLVSVDAPVLMRWERFKECYHASRRQIPVTFEQFVVRSDYHLYDPRRGIAWIIDCADLRLINHGPTLDDLYDTLRDCDLADTLRLRPDWDQYFMKLASLAAQRSNCMKRRVGCVLVREKRVISTGYNGTPRNMKNCNEGGCQSSPCHFEAFIRILILTEQVGDVMLATRRAWVCQLAYVYMRKRMRYLKRVGNGSEKARYYTVTHVHA